MADKYKQTTKQLLKLADVRINGSRPWDIQVHDERLYQRVLSQGTLGLGEGYMDGWWDSQRIDQLTHRVLMADLKDQVKGLPVLMIALKAKLSNLQRKSRAYNIGKAHYDIGNDLYKLMLDKRMNYSCGYWKNADDLNQAQENKLELICRKLGLKKGMSVLDIGCGWGGFLKYAAENYKVKAAGITVSKEQADYARKECKGLDVKIKLEDYRNLKGSFDRIVSVGMIEHVGYKNYRTFLNISKLGYIYFKLHFQLAKADKQTLKKIKQLIHYHPNIVHSNTSFGGWDLEMDTQFKSNQGLYSLIDLFRETFPDHIKSYEFMEYIKEHQFEYMPKQLQL